MNCINVKAYWKGQIEYCKHHLTFEATKDVLSPTAMKPNLIEVNRYDDNKNNTYFCFLNSLLKPYLSSAFSSTSLSECAPGGSAIVCFFLSGVSRGELVTTSKNLLRHVRRHALKQEHRNNPPTPEHQNTETAKPHNTGKSPRLTASKVEWN